MSNKTRTWFDQTALKFMLMPEADGSIETGENLTLTIAVAALMITNAIERLADAVEKNKAAS